jgi:hypothetical protein
MPERSNAGTAVAPTRATVNRNTCNAAVNRAVVEPTGEEPPSYAHGLRALLEDGVPFLVGGGVAMAAYCGIRRFTKDLDVFVLSEDVPRVLGAFSKAGFRTETPFPHWLAKAYGGNGEFIDVIFNSGNGVAPVDREWFVHAVAARLLGVDVALCPPEETIWSKAFVMERERFDGADVVHLLLACGASLDWPRLVRRFGEHWPVLFAHLVLFAYVYPDEAGCVPPGVTASLLQRLGSEAGPMAEACSRTCRGTLLSREQYLPDIARGWRDARLPPTGTMSVEAVGRWTEAIRTR